jgi:phosphoribosylamine--glycine ligase
VKEAAKIEWSKAFSKELMREAKIPTARFETFSEPEAARAFLRDVEWGDGWVVKADGLALGKGVVVCESREEALATAEEFLSGAAHGAAGRRIVVEERLRGREVSVFTLCDGERGALLGMACDYKRIFDGDEGPNTGGMGAFSPPDWLPDGTAARVQAEVVDPLLGALRARGIPYKGILFSGLMITAAGPKVIEFNARFGDPETQVVLPLLDEDLLPWLRAARDGKLDAMPGAGPRRKALHGVHVVLAAKGYPGTPEKGAPISVPTELLPKDQEERERLVKLFFAGVARKGNALVVNGGRVLGLTALGPDRAEARRKAYEILSTVSFAGAQRRSDVGR